MILLLQCWKDDHISPDFPIKDIIDLKFCNICGVGDHSLEDYPIVLEKVMNKRNVNLLHIVPKHDILNSKNLHVVTHSGAGEDIFPEPPNRQKGGRTTYPDPEYEDKLMREAMKFFRNIDQDKTNKGRHENISETTLDEFLQLLKEKQSVGRLIDLLSILREYKEEKIPIKSLHQLSQEAQTNDFDPQVDLEIDKNLIKQVIVDFGSQVNILPRETWVRLGKPPLQPTMNFLKLADHRFIEPIGTLKSVITSIMGILTRVDFEVINLVEGIPCLPCISQMTLGSRT
jgi:hypothetical protein